MDSVVSARPSLGELETEFGESPLKVRKALQLWKTDDYPQFLNEAAAFLKTSGETPFAKLLLSTLRGDGRSLQDLLLKERPLEADEALRVLSLAAKADPSYPVALLGILRGEAEKQSGLYSAAELIRLLELLQSVVDVNVLLPVLTPLCQHPDKQLRSKAVLLAAGPGRKAQANVDALGDMDHRVRANAVEALWGESDEDAIEIFLNALRDPHHRVAGNGLLGLHRAGNAVALQRIPAMLRQGDPNRQMAAAWVMGKTADPRFLGCIETMLPVSTGRTRSNLLHAARAIDERKKRLAALPPVELTLLASDRGEKGRVHCTFTARLQDGDLLRTEDLRATELIVQDGEFRVDAVRLETRGSSEGSHVVLVLPARKGVDDPYAVKLIEAAEAALQAKRAWDHWAILKYEPVWRGEETPSADGAGSVGLAAAIPVEFSTSADGLRSGALRSTKLSAPSLESALDHAFRSFPTEAKHKAVIFVRDKSLTAMTPLANAWQEEALRLRARFYCLLGHSVESGELLAWRRAALPCDGLAVQAASELELPEKLRKLSEAVQGSFHLTYALARLGQGGVIASREPVRMDLYCEKGAGSLRILEE
jgi:hypothetical protein